MRLNESTLPNKAILRNAYGFQLNTLITAESNKLTHNFCKRIKEENK